MIFFIPPLQPTILPVQILRIGQLVILSEPGEFTTMAGRRLRDAVKTVLKSGATKEFGSNIHVVLAGLTNMYLQYITTFEEYQIQRYEVKSEREIKDLEFRRVRLRQMDSLVWSSAALYLLPFDPFKL
ncbi:Neutral ceramidase [Capsicum chinense]|nr:Neutral ceramidase [Capsicum chinense]